jgi:hypothetical protein
VYKRRFHAVQAQWILPAPACLLTMSQVRIHERSCDNQIEPFTAFSKRQQHSPHPPIFKTNTHATAHISSAPSPPIAPAITAQDGSLVISAVAVQFQLSHRAQNISLSDLAASVSSTQAGNQQTITNTECILPCINESGNRTLPVALENVASTSVGCCGENNAAVNTLGQTLQVSITRNTS